MTQQSHSKAYIWRKQKFNNILRFSVHDSTIDSRTWKPPKCPSREAWIKKMQYIYTMEFYPAIKRSKTVSLAEMWRDLETATQTEVSQRKISFIMWNPEKWHR